VIRIVTQHPSLAGRIDDLLGAFESTTKPARAVNIIQVTGEPGEAHRLHRGCHRVVFDEDEGLLPSLIGLINQRAIYGTCSFAVHSAVLAHGGRVVAFPADSGDGKTTLAAAGILEGMAYATDEALVLDDSGQVVPYPKPLALSEWSCETLGLEPKGSETLFTAGDLGGRVVNESRPLTDIVIASYGAEHQALDRRPSSQAVAELIGKSFNHYKDPQRAFRLSTEIARRVRVWKLDYDDPTQAIKLLRESILDG